MQQQEQVNIQPQQQQETQQVENGMTQSEVSVENHLMDQSPGVQYGQDIQAILDSFKSTIDDEFDKVMAHQFDEIPFPQHFDQPNHDHTVYLSISHGAIPDTIVSIYMN